MKLNWDRILAHSFLMMIVVLGVYKIECQAKNHNSCGLTFTVNK